MKVKSNEYRNGFEHIGKAINSCGEKKVLGAKYGECQQTLTGHVERILAAQKTTHKQD